MVEVVRAYADTDIELPKRATPGSAGFDLRAYLPKGSVLVYPGRSVIIPSGIKLNIQGFEGAAMLLSRSGLGFEYGLRLGNCVGLIDQDFQGEIKMALHNDGDEVYKVNHGDRLAQLVFFTPAFPALHFVESFDAVTERGEGGFGHSGVG